MTRLIIEKLLLTPTEQLKALGDADTAGVYAEAMTRLFGLAGTAGTDATQADESPAGSKPRNVEPFPSPQNRRNQ